MGILSVRGNVREMNEREICLSHSLCSLEAENEDIQDKLEEKEALFLKSMLDSKKDVQSKLRDVEFYKERVAELLSKLQNAESFHGDLEDKLEDATETINALKELFNGLENIVTEKESDIVEISEELEELKEKLRSKEEEITSLLLDNHEQEKNMLSLREEKVSLQENIEGAHTLQEQLEIRLENIIDSTSKTNSGLEATIKDTCRKKAKLEELVLSLKSQIDIRNIKNTELQDELKLSEDEKKELEECIELLKDSLAYH